MRRFVHNYARLLPSFIYDLRLRAEPDGIWLFQLSHTEQYTGAAEAAARRERLASIIKHPQINALGIPTRTMIGSSSESGTFKIIR
jgi:hypothetical protein